MGLGKDGLPDDAFPILSSHLGSSAAPRAGPLLPPVQLQRGICSSTLLANCEI